jgi:integrase
MASIRRKTLDGGKVSWEARINIKGHPSASRSFASKKAANDWAQREELRIRGGGKITRMGETLVKVVLDEYLNAHTDKVLGEDGKEVEVSLLSKTKRYAIDSVKYHLGDFSVDALDRKKISGFLRLLQKTEIPAPDKKTKTHPLYDGDRVRTYSPGSARKLFYALKTVIEWHALEHQYQLGDKFSKVDVPAAWSAPRKRRLVDDEETRLMTACDGMYKDPEGWRLLIGLALETAMRAGELLGLRWDEINKVERYIVIPAEREKTRRERQVPLSSKAFDILTRLNRRGAAGEPRVFSTLPKTSAVMGQGFKRITKRSGCVDLRFHDLRHEATSRFFENTDLGLLEISLITGHTEMKTLARYANLRPALLASRLDGGRNGEIIRRLAAAQSDFSDPR